jgi:polysaccharide export outer membrane protein
MRKRLLCYFVFTLTVTMAWPLVGRAQQNSAPPTPSAGASANTVPLPEGYVIGAADVLTIVFWRDKDISGDVTVRPDGKITLPLLNEVTAAGAPNVGPLCAALVAPPRNSSRIKRDGDRQEIHSRNVFITGSVAGQARIPQSPEMTVLQLIASAGGLLEYADSENIKSLAPGTETAVRKFSYNDVVKRQRGEQNILLKPGDTVVVR